MLWPCWRLITAGKAKLEELESWWSIDDVAIANETLDAEAEAMAKANRVK